MNNNNIKKLIIGCLTLTLMISLPFIGFTANGTAKKAAINDSKEEVYSGKVKAFKTNNTTKADKCKTKSFILLVDEMDEGVLKDIAAKKGITVDELKKQLEQKQQKQLVRMAAKKGITVDEIKKQLRKEFQQKLETIAKEKGITINEVRKLLSQRKHRKHCMRYLVFIDINQINADELKVIADKKGITVEQLKAQLKQKQQKQLTKLASKKGITIDELKKELQTKLETAAKRKGITVEQLKQEIANGTFHKKEKLNKVK